jgi:hypothetical protein
LISAAFTVLLIIMSDPATEYFGSIRGSEFNLYGLLIRAVSEEHPDRRPVPIYPLDQGKVDKVVWLVDESIAYSHFRQISGPLLSSLRPDFKILDFGAAISFGNCSAQSNAALRWGVDVASIDASSDLRVTPSIWGYAKKAGFNTTLIDGQVSGPPQNLIWDPERALIDTYIPAASGIGTDRSIARTINILLKSGEKEFVYAVLRGAHYQYDRHYPAGRLPQNSSLVERYHEAIRYSKDGFFKELLSGITEDRVAVFYTSDHGQVLTPGALPHCSNQGLPEEYSVPLLLIGYNNAVWLSDLDPREEGVPSSHSQIFPTTLWLMGYERLYAEANYDRLLGGAPKAIVRFGKSIVPRSGTGKIQVSIEKMRPGAP